VAIVVSTFIHRSSYLLAKEKLIDVYMENELLMVFFRASMGRKRGRGREEQRSFIDIQMKNKV
jgi:hypothetical protein